MEKIHSELLQQFSRKGYSIEGGMAIDARLVKSSAWPKSNEKIKEEKQKREIAEWNLGRTGKPLKFKSDIDSNWTVRDEVPFYGMKEHAAIDVESGLILSTYMSKASEHDTNYFQSIAVRGMQGQEMPPKAYADKGYCSQDNREFLQMNPDSRRDYAQRLPQCKTDRSGACKKQRNFKDSLQD